MKKTINQAAKSAQPTEEKNRTDRQQQAAKRREWLRNISAQFQAQRDLMEVMGAENVPTINEMLRTYYEEQNAVTDLRTYDQWKKEGYQVRKGEKAYLVWGKPKSRQQDEPADEDAPQDEQKTARKDDFYPVCYLFDIAQCHKA